LGNPRLAANYSSGDQIHYRAGSPAEHGIANNSTATVLSIDTRANTLTVATRDANEVSYNPALVKKQTGERTVYREEHRDFAVGERIIFTESYREAHTRSGDFGTVARIAEGNVLSVRLDTGKFVELTPEQSKHIDHGYAVEAPPRAGMDRVLVTGDASQLAQQEKMFTHLSLHTRDLALYTSHSRDLALDKAVPRAEVGLAQNAIAPGTSSVPVPSGPTIEMEGFGIGR
jgi:hypothetical protein